MLYFAGQHPIWGRLDLVHLATGPWDSRESRGPSTPCPVTGVLGCPWEQLEIKGGSFLPLGWLETGAVRDRLLRPWPLGDVRDLLGSSVEQLGPQFQERVV